MVRGGTEAPSGMRTFLAAVQCLLRCDTPRCTREIQSGRRHTRDLIHLQKQPSKVGPKTSLECVRRAICRVLYADDACIVSRSPRGLGRMMVIFVKVFGAFGLTRKNVDHVHADSACIRNVDSLQRHEATVPPDNLIHLFGRRSH